MNCQECNGSGALIPGEIERNTVECPHCEGTGKDQEMEYEEVRPAVKWFATLMEQKLRENDHKANWTGCGIEYLMERLVQEYGELVEATWDLRKENGSPEEVIKEAADIANFCLFIADNASGNQTKDRGK